MRRLIALFLLLVLTLQAPWAVAAAYCQHESAPEAHHFGHHEHVHAQAQAADATLQGSADAEAADSAADLDCPACHACCAALSLHSPGVAPVSTGSQPPGLDQRLLPAPPPTPLERPDWHHPA
jgi:hypothetical protein